MCTLLNVVLFSGVTQRGRAIASRPHWDFAKRNDEIKWVQPVCVRLIFKAITRVFAAGFDPNYGLMPRFDNKLDTANRVKIL